LTVSLSPAGLWPVGLHKAGSRLLVLLCLCLLVFTLSGCGKKKPPPTEIEIKPAPVEASLDVIAVASPLVNPGPDGLPQPVVMRLYQLNGETAFANASFRQLWEADAETLGPTMLGKTELYLAPAEVQRIKANLIEGTTIIAVVVGFRNFEEAKWRAMVGLQGEKKLKLKVDLKTLSVEMGPQD
jgi:type VI secretion system protein VasD